jgi:uncharacterized protein (TIGR02996 family)
MSDGDDLLRAVLDAPEDDAPRLIYADWLDENGQPARAEFVRLQCAMDRIPPNTGRWRPLHDRSIRIEREWREAWAGEILRQVWSATFRRGFLDQVAVTVEQFLSGAAEVLDREPVRLWEFKPVNFFQTGPSVVQLFRHPAFHRVRGLACGHALADELVTALVRAPGLDGLRALSVCSRFPGARAMADLFSAAPNLCELDAEDMPLTNVRDLWRRGMPARLRRLGLAHCRVTDHAVEQMAESAALARLEVLRLDGNDLSDRAAEAIAESDHLTGLRELSLAGLALGDSGAIALARSPALSNLRVLNLSGCYVDNAGAQALADSPHLDRLECLCLDENRVSIEVENELARRFGPDVCSFSWSPAMS